MQTVSRAVGLATMFAFMAIAALTDDAQARGCDGYNKCRCGVTQANLFHLPVNYQGRNLKQASAWRSFPQTSRAPGTVMYQHGGGPTGHVSRIDSITGPCTAMVTDEKGTYERNTCIRGASFHAVSGSVGTNYAQAEVRSTRRSRRVPEFATRRHNGSFGSYEQAAGPTFGQVPFFQTQAQETRTRYHRATRRHVGHGHKSQRFSAQETETAPEGFTDTLSAKSRDQSWKIGLPKNVNPMVPYWNARLARFVKPTKKCGDVPEEMVTMYGNGDGHLGKPVSCGGVLDTKRPTVAHKTAKCGTKVIFVNPRNGKSIQATVTDRGPYTIATWDIGPAVYKALNVDRSTYLCVAGI